MGQSELGNGGEESGAGVPRRFCDVACVIAGWPLQSAMYALPSRVKKPASLVGVAAGVGADGNDRFLEEDVPGLSFADELVDDCPKATVAASAKLRTHIVAEVPGSFELVEEWLSVKPRMVFSAIVVASRFARAKPGQQNSNKATVTTKLGPIKSAPNMITYPVRLFSNCR